MSYVSASRRMFWHSVARRSKKAVQRGLVYAEREEGDGRSGRARRERPAAARKNIGGYTERSNSE